jgi:hypothetical protein
LHGIKSAIPKEVPRDRQPIRSHFNIVVEKSQYLTFGRADGSILSSALPGIGLSDRAKTFAVVALKAMDNRVYALLDLVISRIIGDDDFMLDLASTKVF